MIEILCQLFKIYTWITKRKTQTLMINFQIFKLMILKINKRNFLKTILTKLKLKYKILLITLELQLKTKVKHKYLKAYLMIINCIKF